MIKGAEYEGTSGKAILTCNERTVSLPGAETAKIMVTIDNKSHK
jgi:hypothetical protein